MPALKYRTIMPRPDDPEILESIYADVSRGVPLCHAAVRAGISEWTAYAWVDDAKAEIGDGTTPHGELGSVAHFAQVVKEAHAECVSSRLAQADAAEGNNWQKHITVLERRFPNDFGRNQRIDIKSEHTEIHRIELGQATLAILGRIAELQSPSAPLLEEHTDSAEN